jgi:hypothetical protein
MQHFKSVFGRRLAVFVIRNEAAAEIGRQHFSRFEMLARKRRFAAARRPDEDDKR